MFIPLDKKPDWSTPPFITLLLILINILCFSVWQMGDEAHEEKASDYYLTSSLPGIELPLYQKYLQQPRPPALRKKIKERMAILSIQTKINIMHADGRFLELLKSNKIVTPEHPAFTTWQQQRAQFEQLLSNSISYRYALKSNDPSLLTLFTYMFLHADWGHLIGNIMFLFLFGFVIEITMGRATYLVAYLATGIAAGMLYVVLMPDGAQWLMGASGAISGLAGIYTVLFGLRKIRFFYTLLFYFDYIRAPAILLLPLWLGYELLYQFIAPGNVNNISHIGGLISGALIGLLAKKTVDINYNYINKEQKERNFKEQYQQGLDYLTKMDINNAKIIFQDLAHEHPENINVLEQLFHIEKYFPVSQSLHIYANKILGMQGSDEVSTRLLHDVFIDYVEKTQPQPRLSPELLLALALRFSTSGYIEDAERIILYLTTRKTDFARNPEGLMALATQYKRKNNREKSDKYLKLLLECYPNSDEAKHAQQALG